MPFRPHFAVLACAALPSLIAAASPVRAQSAPTGWKTDRPEPGVVRFTPPDLAPGEIFNVTVFSKDTLRGATIGNWLAGVMTRDAMKPGTPDGPPKITRVASTPQGGQIAGGMYIFKRADGTPAAGIYNAMSTPQGAVYMTRVVFSAQGDLMKRYQSQTGAIIRSVAVRVSDGGESGNTSQGGGSLPGGRAGLTTGGKITPGLYEGLQRYERGTGANGAKIRNHFRLYLYADGEYRLCDQNDKVVEFGENEYRYDSRTGKISIGNTYDMDNGAAFQDTDFSYYGHDQSGKPLIYAENNHGFSTVVTTLRYVGPTKRPSPNAEKLAKAQAEAEARRYKWVTAPGKGVAPGQIAAIVHNYTVATGGMGGAVPHSQVFLLLSDGTIHNGLPVAPDQLSVSLSHQKEPQTWGRWRRAGGGYQVAWAGGGWTNLPGKPVLPAPAGSRLNGRWGTGESEVNLGGSSYRLWGVTFTSGGRFLKDNRGGAGNSQFMQSGGQAAVNSTYDDNGSNTSVLGGNYTIIAGKKVPNPNARRAGTYFLSGYTLTLKYDDGHIERQPFFFGDATKETLWFEGAQLARDTEKK